MEEDIEEEEEEDEDFHVRNRNPYPKSNINWNTSKYLTRISLLEISNFTKYVEHSRTFLSTKKNIQFSVVHKSLAKKVFKIVSHSKNMPQLSRARDSESVSIQRELPHVVC